MQRRTLQILACSSTPPRGFASPLPPLEIFQPPDRLAMQINCSIPNPQMLGRVKYSQCNHCIRYLLTTSGRFLVSCAESAAFHWSKTTCSLSVATCSCAEDQISCKDGPVSTVENVFTFFFYWLSSS